MTPDAIAELRTMARAWKVRALFMPDEARREATRCGDELLDWIANFETLSAPPPEGATETQPSSMRWPSSIPTFPPEET